jgi:hypothetical protein
MNLIIFYFLKRLQVKETCLKTLSCQGRIRTKKGVNLFYTTINLFAFILLTMQRYDSHTK